MEGGGSWGWRGVKYCLLSCKKLPRMDVRGGADPFFEVVKDGVVVYRRFETSLLLILFKL